MSDARLDRSTDILGAHVLVNLDRLPPATRSCYVDRSLDDGLVPLAQADVGLSISLGYVRSDHLSVFAPGQYRHYRQLGPPVIAACK